MKKITKLILGFDTFLLLLFTIFILPITEDYTTEQIQCNFVEYEGCYIEVKNLIENGDFENALTNWSYTTADISNMLVTDGVLSFNGSGNNNYPRIYQYFMDEDNLYYLSFDYKFNDVSDVIRVGYRTSYIDIGYDDLNIHTDFTNNIWVNNSTTVFKNIGSNIDGRLFYIFYFDDAITASNSTIYFDNAMAFNLTELGFDSRASFETFMQNRGYMTTGNNPEWKMFIDEDGVQIRVPCDIVEEQDEEVCPPFEEYGGIVLDNLRNPKVMVTNLINSVANIVNTVTQPIQTAGENFGEWIYRITHGGE